MKHREDSYKDVTLEAIFSLKSIGSAKIKPEYMKSRIKYDLPLKMRGERDSNPRSHRETA